MCIYEHRLKGKYKNIFGSLMGGYFPILFQMSTKLLRCSLFLKEIIGQLKIHNIWVVKAPPQMIYKLTGSITDNHVLHSYPEVDKNECLLKKVEYTHLCYVVPWDHVHISSFIFFMTWKITYWIHLFVNFIFFFPLVIHRQGSWWTQHQVSQRAQILKLVTLNLSLYTQILVSQKSAYL